MRRIIEQNFDAVPKRIRDAYPRDEIINSLWLLFRSWEMKKPGRSAIKEAAKNFAIMQKSTDFIRKETHYRKDAKHGSVYYTGKRPLFRDRQVFDMTDTASEPVDHVADKVSAARSQLVDELAAYRRKFGVERMAAIILIRVLRMEPAGAAEVLGYDLDSALAKSLGRI